MLKKWLHFTSRKIILLSMVQCHIIFDQNPQGTYYSGNIVSGKADIILEKPMDVRAIALVFIGKASVSWSEDETTGTGKDQRTTSTTYSASEDYINSKTYLYGSNSGNTSTINTGIHTYNFTCALPHQLPSSFEGSHGYIRYSVKVIFDRPWKFDKTYTVGFTVLKLVNLNYESSLLRTPSTVQMTKTFWCGPCASNPITIKLNVPQTGYVPGQSIPVTVEILNQSRKKIHHVNISLIKHITYHSSYPIHKTKNQFVTVKKMTVGSIQNIKEEIIREALPIPAIPPTCGDMLCKIIQISYKVCVKASIKGPHISPVVDIPIYIGNIPLVSVINQQPRQMQGENSANLQQISNGTPDLPPPSYEEAVYMNRVKMNAGEEHSIADCDFLPKYPVYHFEPSAPVVDESENTALKKY